MTAVEAKKLVLEREDDLIGHKKMIYVIDKANKTNEPTRKVTTDFFKNTLGFTDNDIIFIDLSEVGIEETKFSDATQEAMKEFARPIFEDTNHSLAKQILNIAILENEIDGDDYLCFRPNFELTIILTEAFTLENARDYFESLA